MKNYALLIALSIVNFNLIAQSNLELTKENKVTRISTQMLNVAEDPSTILLNMGFNAAIPKNKLEKIKLQEIESISLVYTKFRQDQEFNQMQLNANRLDKLYSSINGLKENKDIKWYWVEQTGCNNPEDCNNLFHGFVITLKKVDDKRELETSLLDYYTKIYEGLETDESEIESIIVSKKLPFVKICDTVSERTKNRGNRMARIVNLNKENKKNIRKKLKRVNRKFTELSIELIINTAGKFESPLGFEENNVNAEIIKVLNGEFRMLSARCEGKKIPTNALVTIHLNGNELDVSIMQSPILPDNRKFILDEFLYTTSKKLRCEYVDTSIKVMDGMCFGTTDVVLRAFDRNPQWNNSLVVTDVTGSMYPYLAQFKVWHSKNMKLNSGNHDFVFFNDGDTKPDYLKVTGKVGGNYYVKTNNYEELSKTLTKAMNGGGGGDAPENNIEATIEGLKRNSNLKAVIMIADNFATPRDLALLSQVKVPIRLIVCGSFNGINTAYLEMVRKNKGSIHTMEDDLLNLFELKENETFTLDGIDYVIKNGKIVNLRQNFTFTTSTL